MSDHGTGGIPIVDEAGDLVGLVSEGDLLRRREAGSERKRSWWLRSFAMPQTLAAEYKKSRGRTAADVMTRSHGLALAGGSGSARHSPHCIVRCRMMKQRQLPRRYRLHHLVCDTTLSHKRLRLPGVRSSVLPVWDS